jgi:hypothetical protein
MNEDQHTRCEVSRLQEILFSLNIGFAVTYSLFAYEASSHLADAPKIVRQFLEGFAQMLAHIASLVVSGRTRSEYLRSVVIREAVFAGLMLSMALLLYFPVSLLRRSSVGQLVFAPMAGLAALIAVPGCWLYIVHATWGVYDQGTFWQSYGFVSALEIAAVGLLLYFVRRRSMRWSILAFALHYIFWIVAMGGRSGVPVVVSIPLSLVFPCSGVAWMRYVRALQSPQTAGA